LGGQEERRGAMCDGVRMQHSRVKGRVTQREEIRQQLLEQWIGEVTL